MITMDKIKIRGLEIWAKHGVFPEENVLGQKFVISADLYTNTRSAGKSDDLTQSIHYGEVCQFMKTFMEEHTYQLIETVAEKLAEELLLVFEHLQGIRLEIAKPWAPVGLPLDTVSVEISRFWHRAYLALGSNLGDKEAYLLQGIQGLQDRKDCRVTAVSSFLRTAPYGGVAQDDFLNACLELDTLLTPEELLDVMHEIEQEAGRERLIHWGPRTLDLDIIFYDDIVYDTPELHIPHIDMQNRDFVLNPLAELCPAYRHPLLKKTVEELKNALTEPEEAHAK